MKEQFIFLNSTGFTEKSDFLVYFAKWNDFGYVDICKLIGRKTDLPVSVFCLFKVINIEGNTKGHILNEYSHRTFKQLPSKYVSIFSDVKGCESIFLSLSPEERALLLRSLNVCFADSAMFDRVKDLLQFKRSVLRDTNLESVVERMNECQKLLTSDLDIPTMLRNHV